MAMQRSELKDDMLCISLARRRSRAMGASYINNAARTSVPGSVLLAALEIRNFRTTAGIKNGPMVEVVELPV